MIEEYIKIAWNSLKQRKLRSWLTMLGIFIGIASVVALIAVGQGLQKSISEEFAKIGADKLFIYPKGGTYGIGSAVKLSDDDIDAIEKVKGVYEVSGMVSEAAKFEYDNEVTYQLLVGLDDKARALYSDFASWEIWKGRDINDQDRGKIALGYRYGIKGVFEKEVELRDRIEINGEEFRVVGIYKEIGNSQDDSQAYMNIDEARRILNLDEDEINFIMIQTSPGEEPSKVADAVKKQLRKERGLEEGKEDFSIQTFEDLIESFNVVLQIVNVILIGIASISLLVGSIGIMNTMYTSVLQRTQEIGIMKSIGAKNSTILYLFLIESGMLGLAGGVIGIALGMGIAKIVEIAAAQLGFAMLKVYFPWYLIAGALAFSFLLGSASGILPAYQASKQNAVDAIRYE